MGFFQCYVSLPEALAIPVETFVFENRKKRILRGIFSPQITRSFGKQTTMLDGCVLMKFLQNEGPSIA